jgi:uncharacterized protein YbaA (DUF1428 family)
MEWALNYEKLVLPWGIVMKEKALAEALKRRQLQRSEELVEVLKRDGDNVTLSDFRRRVESLNDEDIILSYITCSSCGEVFCSYEDALLAAETAGTVDEWFDNMENHHHR